MTFAVGIGQKKNQKQPPVYGCVLSVGDKNCRIWDVHVRLWDWDGEKMTASHMHGIGIKKLVKHLIMVGFLDLEDRKNGCEIPAWEVGVLGFWWKQKEVSGSGMWEWGIGEWQK